MSPEQKHDADLDLAVKGAAWAIFRRQGQSCVSDSLPFNAILGFGQGRYSFLGAFLSLGQSRHLSLGAALSFSQSRMAFSSGCLRENIKEHSEEMTETARKHKHVPNGMVVWNALKGEKEYACRVAQTTRQQPKKSTHGNRRQQGFNSYHN
jgi:hypothetical protein